MGVDIFKISVIGNAGSGKTTLSKTLAQTYGLPLVHVDSIQFLPGLKIKPIKESISILETIMADKKWLIDGFGPLDILEKRLQTSDRIIMIDFPIWRNYWWTTKRQIKSIWSPRKELPQGCNEASMQHTLKLYKTLWKVHTQMRPELLRILGRENLKPKVHYIRTLKDWKRILEKGFF